MSEQRNSAHSHWRRAGRKLLIAASALLLLAGTSAASAQSLPQRLAAAGRGGVLFQVSTLDALASGIYDGAFTVEQVKKHGDFGLGTYEGLDDCPLR